MEYTKYVEETQRQLSWREQEQEELKAVEDAERIILSKQKFKVTLEQWKDLVKQLSKFFFYSKSRNNEFHIQLKNTFNKINVKLNNIFKNEWSSFGRRRKSTQKERMVTIVVDRELSPNSTASSKFKNISITKFQFRHAMLYLFFSKDTNSWRFNCTDVSTQVPPCIVHAIGNVMPEAFPHLFPHCVSEAFYSTCKHSWRSSSGYGSAINTWIRPYCEVNREIEQDMEVENDDKSTEGSIDAMIKQLDSFQWKESVIMLPSEYKMTIDKKEYDWNPYDASVLLYDAAYRVAVSSGRDPCQVYMGMVERFNHHDFQTATKEEYNLLLDLLNAIKTEQCSGIYLKELRYLIDASKVGKKRHRMVQIKRTFHRGTRVVMCFDRTKVTPLELFTSLRYISHMYPSMVDFLERTTENGIRNLEWNDQEIELAVTEKTFSALSRILTTYIHRESVGIKSDKARWTPIYPSICSRYLYGSKEETIMSSKMMLKFFMKTQNRYSSKNLSSDLFLHGNEPWFQEYTSILPQLINKCYGSCKRLWFSLVWPYRESWFHNFGHSSETIKRILCKTELWNKALQRLDNNYRLYKESLRGFSAGFANLYRGLETFFHLYARHGISAISLKQLCDYIDESSGQSWIEEDYAGLTKILMSLNAVSGYTGTLNDGDTVDAEEIIGIPSRISSGLNDWNYSKGKKRVGRPKSTNANERPRKYQKLNTKALKERITPYESNDVIEEPKPVSLQDYTLWQIYLLCCDDRLPSHLALALFEGTLSSMQNKGSIFKQLSLSASPERLDDFKQCKLGLLDELEVLQLPFQVPIPGQDLPEEEDHKFENDTESLLYLVEYLERLSQYTISVDKDYQTSGENTFRGLELQVPGVSDRFLPLDNRQMALQPEKYLRDIKLPLYFSSSEEAVYPDQCLPVWRSEIEEMSYRDNVENYEATGHIVKNTKTRLSLFSGSHKDLLSSIVIYPLQ